MRKYYSLLKSHNRQMTPLIVSTIATCYSLRTLGSQPPSMYVQHHRVETIIGFPQFACASCNKYHYSRSRIANTTEHSRILNSNAFCNWNFNSYTTDTLQINSFVQLIPIHEFHRNSGEENLNLYNRKYNFFT